VITFSKVLFLIWWLAQSKALLATKKPIFFNACEWGVEDPWDWMAEYANSWRSGPDHHDNWKSTAKMIDINADKGKYAGEGELQLCFSSLASRSEPLERLQLVLKE